MQTTRDTVLILKKILGYFTWWVLLFGGIYHLGGLQEYYLDILFLHLLMSILSFYLVYIYPKKIHVDLGIVKFDITGYKLMIMDLFCHQLPTLLIILTGGSINKNYLFIWLPLFYRLLNSINERYLIDDITGFAVYIFLLIIYLVK